MNGTADRIIFDLSAYHLAGGAILAFLAFFMYRRTWPPSGRSFRSMLALIRTLAFLSLILFIIDPAFISTTVEERRPLLPILVDISRSMGIEDCEGGISRVESAMQTANSIRAGMEGVDVPVFPFASSVAAEWTGTTAPAADGEGTDIMKSIEKVAGMDPGRRLAGIVILSDGRSTANGATSDRTFPAPVYTVGFGEADEGVDLSLDEVVYEGTSYTGTESGIDCFIRIKGSFDGELEVSLFEGDRRLDSVRVEARGPGEAHPRLRYRPLSEGVKTLTVRIGTVESERIEENNSSLVRIEVLKKALSVLLVDRHPDWDMTYLRSLGRGADRLDVDVVTWRPGSGYYTLEGGESWDIDSGLSGRDIAVFGDGRELFDAEGMRRIEEFVSGGGGLVLLSSEDSPLLDGSIVRDLQHILPLDPAGRLLVREGEFRVTTPGGVAIDPLAAIMASTGILDKVPPLDAVIDGLRPGAASVVSLVSDDGYPLIASRPYGEGVVTVITVFPLWRWALAGEEGQSAYRTLMTSVLEQAAGEMARPPVSVQPDRSVYRSGERIGLSVFVREQIDISRLKGEVFRPDDPDTIPLVTFLPLPRGGSGEAWQATLDPLPHGEYRVRVSAQGQGGENHVGETGLVVDPVSVEFLSTSKDAVTLKRLADLSGGMLVDSDNIEDLLTGLDRSPDRVERSDISPSRSNIILFLLTVFLLSAEWGLRKIRGMI